MKRTYILILAFLIFSTISNAQVSKYRFTVSDTASLFSMIGSTELIGPDLDDETSGVIGIGFDFIFNGKVVKLFSVSSNGLLRLGAEAVPIGTNNNFSDTNDSKIMPLWDDLATGSDGRVHFVIQGQAPKRRLVVEWRTNVVANDQPNISLTFQTVLSEGTNSIDFIYSIPTPTKTTASIGISSTFSDFISISSSTNTSNTVAYDNFNSALSISTGTKFSFYPLSPLITPSAPLLTSDDAANTLKATHTLGNSEILVSENDGIFVTYTGIINVGNVAKPAGYWKFKVKAAAGRAESTIANSPEFSISSVSKAADITPPTITPKNITIQVGATGLAVIKSTDVIESITDAGGVDNSSIHVSPTIFNCFNTIPNIGSSNVAHQAYTANVTTGVQNFGGELGMVFKVNNASGITINQLGTFDHQLDGVTGTQSGGIRVAVFNNVTKTIVPGLDVIIIGLADGLSRNHRIKNISPVILLPGEYMIVAKGYNQKELNGNRGLGSPVPVGDFGGGAISYVAIGMFGSEGSAFNYPLYSDGSEAYLAGTFSYSINGTNTTPATTNIVTHQAYKAYVTTGVQNFGGELGMVFKVNNASGIVIDQLGTFDHQSDGITGTQNGGIRVAVFNTATKKIVTGLDAIIIGLADGLAGNYRMKKIAPVTIPAGEYMIVVKGYNQKELNGNIGLGSPIPYRDVADGAVSYVTTGMFGSEGSGFNYPTYFDGSGLYLAGSFNYQVVNSTPISNNSQTVTITAKDIYGNSANASATVTLICPSQMPVSVFAARVVEAPQAPQLFQKIFNISDAGDVKIFPNPTAGKFTLRLAGVKTSAIVLEVVSENGVTIFKKSMQLGDNSFAQTEIDLRDQPSGLYVLRAFDATGVKIRKVILQH